MVLPGAGVFMAMALVAAPPVDAFAQVREQPSAQSPAQTEPQTQPAPAPPTRRPGRTTRTPRTSPRRPSSATPGTRDEARTSRAAEPTRQELTLAANMLWGYDDNLTAGTGTGAGVTPTAMASGYTGFLDATLDYFRGNSLRSIQVGTTGNLRAYPGYFDHPAAGGVATVEARTTVGQTLTLGASERVGYEPLFNVFSEGASSAPLPPGINEAVPATGLFERRSLSSRTSMSLEHQWTRRDSSSIAYSYRAEHFTDDDYGDNRAHDVLAEQRRRLGRGARVRASYRYVNGEYTEFDGAMRPTREHRIEGGPEFETSLSRRRRLAVSLGAGAAYVESLDSVGRDPVNAWVPTASGRATLDVTPLWTVDGGYARGFSLLRGVTDEVYTTDTAFLSTGGLVTTRLNLRVGGTYSNWTTPFASGADGRLNVYGASLLMSVALTRTVSAAAGYYYYHHEYTDPGELPEGFPSKYDRHAVRVGLTVAVPLMGAPPLRPLGPR